MGDLKDPRRTQFRRAKDVSGRMLRFPVDLRLWRLLTHFTPAYPITLGRAAINT